MRKYYNNKCQRGKVSCRSLIEIWTIANHYCCSFDLCRNQWRESMAEKQLTQGQRLMRFSRQKEPSGFSWFHIGLDWESLLLHTEQGFNLIWANTVFTSSMEGVCLKFTPSKRWTVLGSYKQRHGMRDVMVKCAEINLNYISITAKWNFVYWPS